MFFIDEAQASPAARPAGAMPPASISDVFEAAWKSTVYVENANARATALEEAYDERIDKIFQATGQKLDNPTRKSWSVWAFPDYDPHAEFEEKRRELSKAYPQHGAEIAVDRPLIEDAKAKARAAESGLDDALARYDGPAGSGTLASLAGGVYGTAFDPLQWATLLAGPTGRAGAGIKGLLWMGAKQGAANAGVETAMQPEVARWRTEAGLGYDATTFAANVGAAGLFGFGMDAGIRGGYRALQGARGRVPRLDANGGVEAWETPQAALDRSARNSQSETLRKAAEGDLPALQQLARETGIADHPEVKSAFEAAGDLEATDFAARLKEEPGWQQRLGEALTLDPHELTDVEQQVARHMLDPEHEPMPAPPEPIAKAARGDDLKQVATDVGAALDKIKPGQDAISVARAELDSGQLDPVAAADLMRRVPQAVDNTLSLATSEMRMARALARLSEDAFAAVQAGAVPPRMAAIVGQLVADAARHSEIIGGLARLQPEGDAAIRHAIKTLLEPPGGTRRLVGGIDDPLGPEGERQVAHMDTLLARDIELATGTPPAEVKPDPKPRKAKPYDETVSLKILKDAGPVDAFGNPARQRAPARRGDRVPVRRDDQAVQASRRTSEGGAMAVMRAMQREGVKGVEKELEKLGPAGARDVAARLAGDLMAAWERLGPEQRAKLLAARVLDHVADLVKGTSFSREQRQALLDQARALEREALGPSPGRFQVVEPMRNQQRWPHPVHKNLMLPLDGDGFVRFYRGDAKAARPLSERTARIYTTSLERAIRNAGPDGALEIVRLGKEELGKAQPRSSSKYRVKIKDDQDAFLLPYDVAAKAKRVDGQAVEELMPGAARAAEPVDYERFRAERAAMQMQARAARLEAAAEDAGGGSVPVEVGMGRAERAAMEKVPEVRLGASIDDHEALMRLKDLMENCKL